MSDQQDGGGPGRAERAGVSWAQLMSLFDTEAKARRWFERQRWPHGVRCAWCDGERVNRAKPPAQPYRCLSCGRRFSVKANTFMHRSPLPLSKWGLALYLVTTGLKGVSSMKLHRDLGITQKSAWHLLHRIRAVLDDPELKAPRRKASKQARRNAISITRARMGTFHQLSEKHLPNYVSEVRGRDGIRSLDTLEQMGLLVRRGVGRRLSYADLTGRSDS